MPDEQGNPTPEEQAAADAAAAAVPVTADEPEVQLPPDRPAVNVLAEMRRRAEKTDREMAELRTMLSQVIQQQVPRPAAAQPTEYTDDQLRQLAEQGNVQAQTMLAERAAQRVAQQANQAQQFFAQAQQRVNDLVGRYPGLRDTNNPLNQEAYKRKQQLLASGAYQGLDPNLVNLLSTVQAIQETVTESPELALQARAAPSPSPGASDAAELARQSAARQASAPLPPNAPRRPPGARGIQAPQGQPIPFTKEEKALAARMGIADPDKAIRRFAERHDRGRSSIQPNALGIITQQGDAKRFGFDNA